MKRTEMRSAVGILDLACGAAADYSGTPCAFFFSLRVCIVLHACNYRQRGGHAIGVLCMTGECLADPRRCGVGGGGLSDGLMYRTWYVSALAADINRAASEVC